MTISIVVQRKAFLFAGSVAMFGLSTFMGINSAQAAIINGGFETGTFEGWTTLGEPSVITAGPPRTPTEGRYHALLVNKASSDAELESFLGLTTGELDSFIGEDVVSGSAVKQTFMVEAGATLTFSHLYYPGDYWYPKDFAFYSLSDAAGLVSTLGQLGSLIGGSLNSFSYTFNTSGTYTLGLGVVDVPDTAITSFLFIDDVKLSSPTAIPTPALLPGLIGLGVAAMRKRKSEATEESAEA